MRLRRLVFVFGSLSAIFLLWLLWDNALILESFHRDGWKESYKQALLEEDNKRGDSTYEVSAQITKNSGHHIHINLDQLIMYVYIDGELQKTYPVSGGKTNTPSPVGTWKIISKDTWGEGFGGAWLGFNVPWGMYGIHGTIEPWFVGRSNSSEGCIRMKNADVKELYKMVPHGTTVTIAYENIPFRTMMHGNVGTDVFLAEKGLKELGYYNGSLDGVFGNTLDVSVRKFQKDNRLYVTGKINSNTYQLIMDLSKEIQEMQ